VDGGEECRRYLLLCAPVWNASAVVFRKEVYERVGMADERMRVSADYKVWAQMAMTGKVGYVAEPLSYYRTHGENVRTRTQASALDLAEYFYVMLWVVERAEAGKTPDAHAATAEAVERMPAEMEPRERIEAAKRDLTYVAEWNLRNNKQVRREAMRSYFVDWEFALTGRGFAIAPPNRWQYFLHRWRFYRHYFSGMGWKQRVVNLGRVFGAPLVGYRRRHRPEQAFARVTEMLNAVLGKRSVPQGPSANG